MSPLGLAPVAEPASRDLALAAYNEFHGLDGAFDGNVVLQIKNGPYDFQVNAAEPPHTLPYC